MFSLRRLVMLAAAGFLTASNAAAVDGKNYAAAQCVQVQGNGILYSNATILNPSSSSTMVLDCPAVKDGTDIDSGLVKALDQSGSSVDCTLLSLFVSGSGIFGYSDGDATTGNSSSWQTLHFGSMSANSNGWYWMSCSIPPTSSGNMSGIAMYKIVEN